MPDKEAKCLSKAYGFCLCEGRKAVKDQDGGGSKSAHWHLLVLFGDLSCTGPGAAPLKRPIDDMEALIGTGILEELQGRRQTTSRVCPNAEGIAMPKSGCYCICHALAMRVEHAFELFCIACRFCFRLLYISGFHVCPL